jgi:energy-coupling factor transporter ATP-binding protein EcfA2
MLKLKRLRVERFRSLARGAELLFSDGINVVLGQNGTGKTTLLELISMVVRSDFSSLAKEEFAIEYELSTSEEMNVVVVIRNERMIIGQAQTPTELGAREVFRPSAEVLGGPERRLLRRYDAEGRVMAGDVTLLNSKYLTPLEPGFLFFFLPSDAPFNRIAIHTLPNVCNALRFDESLELFRKITSAGELAGDMYVDKRSHHWVALPFAAPFVPDSVLVQLAEAFHNERKPDYSLTHVNLKLLFELNDMMGFSTSDLRVDVAEQRGSVPALDVVKLSSLVFRFRWEDGTLTTHERLSYGQKRLLTFFYYLACNPDIVIADELVNGLHHRWITASIEAIGLRQAFLTSQNPLLLDYIPITSAEQARRSFVLCRGEPRSGRPGWIWENMNEDDAAELLSAYQVGVEHVSEILQSRGLW